MSRLVEVNYWAEGPTDRAVARRLIVEAGGVPGPDYSKRRGATPGKDHLDARLPSFNSAARFSPWLVLRDTDGQCAMTLVEHLLPHHSEKMCLRLVVPTVEAWLLADRQAIAEFLHVDPAVVPRSPEAIVGLKDYVVGLAKRSRSRDVRSDLLPSRDGGRRHGPGYSQRLIDFAVRHWNPSTARNNSQSLSRAIERLTQLVSSC